MLHSVLARVLNNPPACGNATFSEPQGFPRFGWQDCGGWSDAYSLATLYNSTRPPERAAITFSEREMGLPSLGREKQARRPEAKEITTYARSIPKMALCSGRPTSLFGMGSEIEGHAPASVSAGTSAIRRLVVTHTSFIQFVAFPMILFVRRAGIVLPSNLQALHFRLQRGAFQPKPARCSFGPRDDPARFPQNADDVLPLRTIQSMVARS